MTSSFIRSQSAAANLQKERASLLSSITSTCWALTGDALPPKEMMNIIGSADEGHFKSNMISLFSEFYWRNLLSPTSSVVDLGCGCGRLGIPIARLVTEGRYYGIDVWKEGLDWCSDHITGAYPHATFHCLEAANNYYFDDRKDGESNRFSLPFIPDNSVDFVFAISLFSHLLESDALAYYREMGRFLKPSGVGYITGFIIDDHFHDYSAKTGNHRGLKEEEPGCYYGYKGQDFFSGFTLDVWKGMFALAGLEILSLELGSWAKKPGARPYQDTFIVAPRRQRAAVSQSSGPEAAPFKAAAPAQG